MNNAWPLLSLCVLWPLFGAITMPLAARWQACRAWAVSVTLFELLLTVGVVVGFDAEQLGWQWQEQRAWVDSLHIQYQLAVDGLSVFLLPATALVTLLGVLASWRQSCQQSWGFWACLLMLEAATLGVLTATDLILFFFCWELTLPPIALLVARWGIGPQRVFAATQYTLLMLFGGAALLMAIALLALNHAEVHQGQLSFSLPVLLETPIAANLQAIVLLLLGLAFAIKAPLPPFHHWLSTLAMQAPPVLTAMLLGMKLGVYGIVRLLIPLLPEAVATYRGAISVWALVAVLYAALLAIRQHNLRSVLAYASVSHVGLVVLALMTLNVQAWQGAVMQLLNFALIAASLMVMAGMLEQRFASTEYLHLGGLARVMPRFTGLFFLLAFASLGVPGSSGLVAEWLMLLGIMQVYPLLVGLVLLAAILAAAYMVQALRQIFWGPLRLSVRYLNHDLQAYEWVALLPSTLLLIGLGCWPDWLLRYQAPAVEYWLGLLKPVIVAAGIRN